MKVLLFNGSPERANGCTYLALSEIAKTLDIPLLDTYIHASVALTKAQILQQDLTAYPAKNKAVADYGTLVDELLQKGVL